MIATLAAVAIGVHMGSVHLNPELAGPAGYNDVNPGLYVRSDSGYQLGAYRNSDRRTTVYAGKLFSYGNDVADVGVFVGAGTGYTYAPVIPMAAATVRLGPARLSVSPRIGNKASAAVHLSLEARF